MVSVRVGNNGATDRSAFTTTRTKPLGGTLAAQGRHVGHPCKIPRKNRKPRTGEKGPLTTETSNWKNNIVVNVIIRHKFTNRFSSVNDKVPYIYSATQPPTRRQVWPPQLRESRFGQVCVRTESLRGSHARTSRRRQMYSAPSKIAP